MKKIEVTIYDPDRTAERIEWRLEVEVRECGNEFEVVSVEATGGVVWCGGYGAEIDIFAMFDREDEGDNYDGIKRFLRDTYQDEIQRAVAEKLSERRWVEHSAVNQRWDLP